MVHMAIGHFVNVRGMRDLLYKVLSERKIIGRYMINNVKIRARKNRLELDYANINIDPNFFDTSYITSYQDTVSALCCFNFFSKLSFDVVICLISSFKHDIV